MAQTSTAVAQVNSDVSDAIAKDFLAGATPIAAGIELDLPVIGDNPSAVPVRAVVTESFTDTLWCEEMIILAEMNPRPLAARFKYTKLAGVTDVAIRVRIMQSMTIRAIARMSDGRFLEARKEVNVTAGGCGM